MYHAAVHSGALSSVGLESHKELWPAYVWVLTAKEPLRKLLVLRKREVKSPWGKKKNWIGELPTFHSAASGRGVLSKVLPSWIMTEKLPLLSDYCTFRQKSMGWCPRHLSGTWLSHTFRATSTQRERQWKGGAVTLRVSSVSKVRPNPTPPTFFAAGSSGHFGSRLPLFTCWARLSTRKR